MYCYLVVMTFICRVHCTGSGEESSEAESVYSNIQEPPGVDEASVQDLMLHVLILPLY